MTLIRYIIGPVEILMDLFPEKDWDHQRLSLDGSLAVVDVDLDPDAIAEMELEHPEIDVYTHDEALEQLNAESAIGIWRTDEPDTAPDGDSE